MNWKVAGGSCGTWCLGGLFWDSLVLYQTRNGWLLLIVLCPWLHYLHHATRQGKPDKLDVQPFITLLYNISHQLAAFVTEISGLLLNLFFSGSAWFDVEPANFTCLPGARGPYKRPQTCQ